MSNTGFVIPSDIRQILEERDKTWQEFDVAQDHVQEMEKRSSQVVIDNFAQLPTELTNEKTPPAEIAAAYQNFQTEMAKISQAQESIKVYQAEIKKIQSQRTTRAILIGIGIVIILAIAVCAGSAIINAIISSFQN
ncbi:MAG: hypothetical protein IPP66_13655 [Anaerolineales bacterium]|nr:hypothetical protein [Anaerolineales bacterium]